MIFNPVIPVPALISAAAVAVLVILIALIRSRENRILSAFVFFVRAAIIALTFIIALRPMRETHGTDVQLSNLDVLFVLDTTLSMWATDGPDSTRFAAAEEDIEKIMEELEGANFGLITFRNSSEVAAPFTQDADTVLRFLKNIQTPDKYYVTGSRMDVPYYDLENMLISSDRKENRQTICFFLSDGEDTSSNKEPYSYEALECLVDGGAVIGYGSSKGGEMVDENGFNVRSSDTYDIALSYIDQDNLEKIADDLGVEYVHRTGNGLMTILEDCLDEIKALSGTVTETNSDYTYYEDTFFKYTPYLAGLIALELFMSIRAGVGARRKHVRKEKEKK